jgi:VanZ family protein
MPPIIAVSQPRVVSSQSPPVLRPGLAALPKVIALDARKPMSKLLPWFPVAAVMAVIFMLSCIPGSSIPHLFSFQDIALHAIIYAVFGSFFSPALRSALPKISRRRAVLLTVVFCFLYGLSDEFHQIFVPGRTASFSDVMVDLAGGIIGVLLRK